MIESRLRTILSGRPTNRVRVIHEAAAPQHELPAPFAGLLAVVGGRVAPLLVEWTTKALRSEIEQRGDAFRTSFIAAADASADGLTLSIRVRQPALLPALRRMMASPAALGTALALPRAIGGVQVDVAPGYVT
jgi:hypothetical protein